MKSFTRLDAVMAPMPLANIDTDQIIRAEFMKGVDREGLGQYLFYGFRFDDAGAPKPDFVLNRPEYKGTQVIVAGDNFGCGSSREHAPWALMDYGISCVISTSFADIFYNNCFQNGLLPVVLQDTEVQQLVDEAKGGNHRVTIDLAEQTVRSPSGKVFRFDIDPARKEKMLKGLDSIGVTLQLGDQIDLYESKAGAGPALAGAGVTVLVAGTVRVAPDKLEALRPHMRAMMDASNAEDGCSLYSYAEDVAEPGLIRIFEIWRDGACLERHFQTPHMAAWRAAGKEAGLYDRAIRAYEVAAERPI